MKHVHCPNCTYEGTKVKESRKAEEGASVRRRRECSSCGHRFTTYERYERGPLYVRKRGGERQPFDRAKLRGGLARATHKRPVGDAEIETLVERITAEAERAGGELAAPRIGEMCLEGLRRIDRVSYLQFAAVYKQLDVGQVQAELAELDSEPGPRSEPPLENTPLVAPIGAVGSIRPEGDPGEFTPEAAVERREVDVEDR
jgi:transcriptional repressor NrdR